MSQLLPFILGQPDLVALTAPQDDVEQGRRAVVALHTRAIASDEPDLGDLQPLVEVIEGLAEIGRRRIACEALKDQIAEK